MLEALSFFNVFLIVCFLKHPCSSVFFLSLKKPSTLLRYTSLHVMYLSIS